MTNESAEISSALRQKMESLAHDSETIVRRTYATLMDSDDEFAALAEAVRLDEIGRAHV